MADAANVGSETQLMGLLEVKVAALVSPPPPLFLLEVCGWRSKVGGEKSENEDVFGENEADNDVTTAPVAGFALLFAVGGGVRDANEEEATNESCGEREEEKVDLFSSLIGESKSVALLTEMGLFLLFLFPFSFGEAAVLSRSW